MVLPASGTITLEQFRSEMGDTGSIDLAWIFDNTKDGQRSYSMNAHYSKSWYQRNTDGNCNNGNCTNNCNCGNIQCANCFISGGVNCANCDARAWLQNCPGNYNCACTYNCATSQTASYNCNCACDCSNCIGDCG